MSNDVITDYNCIDWFKHYPSEKRKEIHNHLTDDFAVLCLNVCGDANLGNMIRTASLFGCHHFFLAGRKKWDKRYSVGAHHYMDVSFLPNIFDVTIDTHHDIECRCGGCKTINHDALVKFLNDEMFTPVFIEQGGSIIQDDVWKKVVKRPIFIYGNETSGIPSSTIQFVKRAIPDTLVLSIPQMGIMRSHNVATTCSIVIWEYMRNKMTSSFT